MGTLYTDVRKATDVFTAELPTTDHPTCSPFLYCLSNTISVKELSVLTTQSSPKCCVFKTTAQIPHINQLKFNSSTAGVLNCFLVNAYYCENRFLCISFISDHTTSCLIILAHTLKDCEGLWLSGLSCIALAAQARCPGFVSWQLMVKGIHVVL